MCGTDAPGDAATCNKCGYAFGGAGSASKSASEPARNAGGMTIFGWIFTVVGAGIGALAAFRPISVPADSTELYAREIVNIGLVQSQTMLAALGGVLFVAGVILIAAGAIVTAIAVPTSATPLAPAAP